MLIETESKPPTDRAAEKLSLRSFSRVLGPPMRLLLQKHLVYIPIPIMRSVRRLLRAVRADRHAKKR